MAIIKFGECINEPYWRNVNLTNAWTSNRSRERKRAIVMDSYEIDYCIRGFHVYNTVWNPVIGEELICRQEPSNTMDPYAVLVIEDSIIVGHLPRNISAVCAHFIDLGGRINCCVTGSRRYSEDLPQGGLEIPCKIFFRGSTQHVAKVKKLVRSFLPKRKSANPENLGQPAKKIKVEDVATEICESAISSTSCSTATSPDCNEWVKLNKRSLSSLDKSIIVQGLW